VARAAEREIAPGVKRVGAILDRNNVSSIGFMGSMESLAPRLGVNLNVVGYRDGDEIERAIDGFGREPNSGLICLPSPVATSHRRSIIGRADRLGLPATYAYRYFVKEGGLISFGIDIVDLFRRAGPYVDAILRGAKPESMPVQAPTKFELAVNLRTAKALGLTIPQSIFARADEVIE
jgi:putative ABC transport system substrate-binding protein